MKKNSLALFRWSASSIPLNYGSVWGFTIHEDRTLVYLDGDFYFLSFLVINYILIPLRVSQTCFIIIIIFTLEQSS